MQKLLKCHTKFFLSLVLIFFDSIITPNVVCSKLIYYPFEERVNRSDVIIYGKVESVRKRFFEKDVCVFTAERVIFGDFKKPKIIINFGRKSVFYAKEDLTNFKIGRYYVLFLRRDNENFNLVGAHQGCYLVREDGKICLNNDFIELKKFIEKIEEIEKGNR